MKALLLSFLLIGSVQADDFNLKACQEFVQARPFLGICGGDFIVEKCEVSNSENYILCYAEGGWNSSYCYQKIKMSLNCDYNISTTIVRDEREDI